jgi:hypothetical protein
VSEQKGGYVQKYWFNGVIWNANKLKYIKFKNIIDFLNVSIFFLNIFILLQPPTMYRGVVILITLHITPLILYFYYTSLFLWLRLQKGKKRKRDV